MTPLVMSEISKTRGYGARAVQVLHGVSLVVEAGEFVLLEGPSGSGKTTLLAVGGGILTPESGTVQIEDYQLHKNSRAQDRRKRARTIGFVFQRSNLLPHLTVRENILLMGQIAGLRDGETAGEADDLLLRLGILKLRDRYPNELSCGEEQRVAVARALIHRPAVVLADEPTGNLDRRSGEAVAESLAELARLRNSAVLVATHDIRLSSYASRTIHIEDGRLSAPHRSMRV
jgi:putative ABC transport system ATP-binding protein